MISARTRNAAFTCAKNDVATPAGVHRHRPRDDGARAAPGRDAARTRRKPNPMVGCVIAQGDEIVGTGWHERKGGPHAEVFALQAAGERARGATAYVTLEPCSHVGSTGPCADALIAAGVTRVVGAISDPFPQVDGSGFEKLRAAGIQVDIGLMEAQARALNKRIPLAHRTRASVVAREARDEPRRPQRAGLRRFEVDQRRSRAARRAEVARTRRRDPHRRGHRADGRSASHRAPRATTRRSSRRCASCSIRAWRPCSAATSAKAVRRRCTSTPRCAHAARRRSRPRRRCPSKRAASISAAVLKLLAEREINEVQVEAGATLAGAFLTSGLVDELLLYVAPVMLGERARPLFDNLHIDEMTERLNMHVAETRRIGEDIRVFCIRGARRNERRHPRPRFPGPFLRRRRAVRAGAAGISARSCSTGSTSIVLVHGAGVGARLRQRAGDVAISRRCSTACSPPIRAPRRSRRRTGRRMSHSPSSPAKRRTLRRCERRRGVRRAGAALVRPAALLRRMRTRAQARRRAGRVGLPESDRTRRPWNMR